MKLILKILLVALMAGNGSHGYAQVIQDGILVLSSQDELPADAKIVDNIRIIDWGLKINCGYMRTMKQARDKAEFVGGNVLRITKLKKPDAWSSCYRVWGDVYKMDNVHDYVVAEKTALTESERAIDSSLKDLLPDTASYALLFVYRPDDHAARSVPYNLHVGDSVVCRVKKQSKFLIKLYTKGPTHIWARTDGRDDMIVDIAPGKVCFIRCSAGGVGSLVAQPKLAKVSPYEGFPEYNAIVYEE